VKFVARRRAARCVRLVVPPISVTRSFSMFRLHRCTLGACIVRRVDEFAQRHLTLLDRTVSFKGVASLEGRSRSFKDQHQRQTLRGTPAGHRVAAISTSGGSDWNRLRTLQLPKTRSSTRGERAQSI
jgi:hypothetical protein